jgi:hypothetical protein
VGWRWSWQVKGQQEVSLEASALKRSRGWSSKTIFAAVGGASNVRFLSKLPSTPLVAPAGFFLLLSVGQAGRPLA